MGNQEIADNFQISIAFYDEKKEVTMLQPQSGSALIIGCSYFWTSTKSFIATRYTISVYSEWMAFGMHSTLSQI